MKAPNLTWKLINPVLAIAIGIARGIAPCLSALILLLSAVALHQAYVFSLGVLAIYVYLSMAPKFYSS